MTTRPLLEIAGLTKTFSVRNAFGRLEIEHGRFSGGPENAIDPAR